MQPHDVDVDKQRVTPCILLGLLCIFLGGICLTGYFLTPDDSAPNPNDPVSNEKYQFSDKPHALPFGIAFMTVGFLLLLGIVLCQNEGADC